MLKLSGFVENIIYCFLISFGVIIGTSLFAGIGAIINNHPPLKTMLDVAYSIKLWAVAVALGGAFSPVEIIEKGLFNGEIKIIIKQTLYVTISLIGAKTGCFFIKLFKECTKYF